MILIVGTWQDDYKFDEKLTSRIKCSLRGNTMFGFLLSTDGFFSYLSSLNGTLKILWQIALMFAFVQTSPISFVERGKGTSA